MSGVREPVVRVEEVVKDFRPGLGLRSKRILHGISFDVHEGEIFGFVGPNGAGKTTTLKILMGLIRASGGRATILGCDVREAAFRQHVGVADFARLDLVALDVLERVRVHLSLSRCDPVSV